MAGARALWRATGVKEEDFGKPVIAVVNSFTQFVPGHVHLDKVGKYVREQVEKAGGIAHEFNTIAIDDGIAMGHEGMLYSLPSRELIADSVEYMCAAHCVDAMICISNCDKITPGMMMAAMRLNIPAIFVSGGPMEAGVGKLSDGERKLDLIDAMIAGANPNVSDADSRNYGAQRMPHLRILLRNVHCKLNELPCRGHRPGSTRKRNSCGDARGAQKAVCRRRKKNCRHGKSLL